MNINNFEKDINQTILNRGYEYYLEGCITQMAPQEDDIYTFYVEGTEDYVATVQINDKEDILHSQCSCPYDYGPVCKHEAAVYFLLREILGGEETPETQPSSLREVLDAQSKEELVNLLLMLAQTDETLEGRLLLRYSTESDDLDIQQTDQLIQSIKYAYAGNGGFISYRDVYDFTDEMEGILDFISLTKNPLMALDMAFLLLEEAVEALQYADDSSGYIGGLIHQTLSMIGEVIEEVHQASAEVKEQVYDKLVAQTASAALEGWEDTWFALLEMCVPLAETETKREKLTERIIEHIQRHAKKKNSDYTIERLFHVLLSMIETYETEEEAEAFLKEHIRYSSFREKLIQKNIERRDDEQVILYALEGEEKDKQAPGLIMKWKTYRYEAYRRLSMKEKQRELAKDLLFHGGLGYYKELKELSEESHKEFYSNLKKELAESKDWAAERIYLQLILKENDVKALMEYVRQHPRTIDQYAGKLTGAYKEEAAEIYRDLIEFEAEEASNRKMYQRVCRIIKRYSRIAGDKKKNELIRSLQAQYKRRPAFIDELNKIK